MCFCVYTDYSRLSEFCKCFSSLWRQFFLSACNINQQNCPGQDCGLKSVACAMTQIVYNWLTHTDCQQSISLSEANIWPTTAPCFSPAMGDVREPKRLGGGTHGSPITRGPLRTIHFLLKEHWGWESGSQSCSLIELVKNFPRKLRFLEMKR